MRERDLAEAGRSIAWSENGTGGGQLLLEGVMSRAATLLFVGVLSLNLGVLIGTLHGQPLNRPILPPDPNKAANEALKRIDDQEKAKWEWISWVPRPSVLCLMAVLLVHLLNSWRQQTKAMEELKGSQDEKNGRSRSGPRLIPRLPKSRAIFRSDRPDRAGPRQPG